jgi:hypothetical protein
MTTSTPTRALHRQMPNVNPIPDHLLGLVPDTVVAASKTLANRQAQLEAANVKARDAQTAAEQAPDEDRKAAAAAVEAGKSMPKEKAPAARAALDGAMREQEAQRDLFIASADAFLAEVRAAHGEIASSVVAEIENVAEQTGEDFERLEAALIRTHGLRIFQRAIGEDTGHLEGRSPDFTPARQGRQALRDPLTGGVREMLDGLREAVGA